MTDWRFISRSRHPAGNRSRGPAKALRRLADGLCFAAAPTFVLMALATYFSSGVPDMLCATMPGASAFGGMTAMYLLMGAFHLTPWLRRMSAGERWGSQRGRASASNP
jgi:hypothetical protein